MTEEILINEGKYRFKIVSNQLKNKDGEIYCYSFKIGGNYSDCVNVSISYDIKKGKKDRRECHFTFYTYLG